MFAERGGCVGGGERECVCAGERVCGVEKESENGCRFTGNRLVCVCACVCGRERVRE